MLGLMIALPSTLYAGSDKTSEAKTESTIDERKAIRKGNKLYEDKRYAEAEVEYKRALQYNPNSDIANYNLALSYLRQGGSSDPKDSNSPVNQASQILRNVVKTAHDKGLASRAYYNLGNIAFNQQNYSESIEMYKDALRRNPDDDQARQNLRLAQKKQQEQQQQDQNQDKNQDKDKQNKDQNQKNDDNKENKDKNRQDQQNQQNKPNQNKPQDRQQGGMSDSNVQQILKAMQDAEKGTQQKVNAAKIKEEQNNRKRTGNQW